MTIKRNAQLMLDEGIARLKVWSKEAPVSQATVKAEKAPLVLIKSIDSKEWPAKPNFGKVESLHKWTFLTVQAYFAVARNDAKGNAIHETRKKLVADYEIAWQKVGKQKMREWGFYVRPLDSPSYKGDAIYPDGWSR